MDLTQPAKRGRPRRLEQRVRLAGYVEPAVAALVDERRGRATRSAWLIALVLREITPVNP